MVVSPVRASLRDIQLAALPSDPAVKKAFADVRAVEDLASEWHDPWKFDTPKAKVASTLKTSLAALQNATKAAPDNEELLLLTGLVARYAYNVDVDGSHEIATDVLAKAHKLAPNDYRPEWFQAMLQCQTVETKDGMEKFLAIENSTGWGHLDLDFWDDYLFCATVTDMPAHALRAADHEKAMGAAASRNRDFLIDVARKRFIPADPNKTYPPEEIWSGEQSNSEIVLTSTMFGVQFSAEQTWKPTLRDVVNQIGTAQFQVEPHPGKAGHGVTPNILLFMRAPKDGEALTAFVISLMPNSIPHSISVPYCPVQDCSAFEADSAETYKDEGGGHAIIVAFQRNSPEYPGLLFERPSAPPTTEVGKTTYAHPTERIRRLDGPLYYLVLLDTADSVLTYAKIDFDTFLKSLHVE